MPIPGALGLSRAVGDPLGAEGGGGALLRGIPEDIRLPRDLEIFEPCFCYLEFKLCFQQSPGDSTGPQLDAPSGAFRDGFLD